MEARAGVGLDPWPGGFLLTSESPWLVLNAGALLHAGPWHSMVADGQLQIHSNFYQKNQWQKNHSKENYYEGSGQGRGEEGSWLASLAIQAQT